MISGPLALKFLLKFGLLLMLGVPCLKAGAQTVSLTGAGGWLESAWIEWLPVEGAESYQVYYSGEGISRRQIDQQLIRSYGAHFRADIPGLRAGSYTLEVCPLISGTEQAGSISESLLVEAHDRTGFAFSGGRVPGAYQANGRPRSNAVVLYITEKTKNTLSLDVEGANENPCVGLQSILDGFKKGKDLRPLIIRLVGQISDPEVLYKGDIVIENDNNASAYITFEGVGEDAVADGWGIRVKNASNIEIRNLGIMNCNSDEGDNISLQQDNDHIWVHHVDFFYGDPGSDSDQAKGDGALDCKRSDHVTISYNHFWDSGKSNLLGNGTEDPRYLSYHHNWYDHSDSRHPRVRSHSVHVYNNYYDGNAKYGVGATLASSVFVEANYFRNCAYPILTSMQGSDVYDSSTGANDYSDMPTFSKEDGGSIKAFNNHLSGFTRFVAWGDDNYPNPALDFDAWVAASREEQVPATVVSAFGGNPYNNFDTDPAIMYSYTADSPDRARDRVLQYAGRLHGGDFSWTFDDATEDISYEVNTDLKAALEAYTTDMVFIQGDGQGMGQPDTSTFAPGEIPAIELGLFPNPVENILYLSGGTRIRQMDLHSLTGALLSSVQGPLSVLDMKLVPSGLYLLRIHTEEGVFSRKIIRK